MSNEPDMEASLGGTGPDSSDVERGPFFEPPLGLSSSALPRERIVEEIFALRRSTIPLASKLKPEQFAQVLRISELAEKNDFDLKALVIKSRDRLVLMILGVVIFVVLAVLGLCWMFFAFGKADQVSNIINTLIVACGGVGSGVGITAGVKRITRKPDDELPS